MAKISKPWDSFLLALKLRADTTGISDPPKKDYVLKIKKSISLLYNIWEMSELVTDGVTHNGCSRDSLSTFFGVSEVSKIFDKNYII